MYEKCLTCFTCGLFTGNPVSCDCFLLSAQCQHDVSSSTDWFFAICRDHAKANADVETTTGQVKQAQDVVPPMERLVKGLEQQQADTVK